MNPVEKFQSLVAKTFPYHKSVQEAIDLKGALLDTNSKEAKLPYYSFCVFYGKNGRQYDRWRIWLTREGVITSDKDIAVPDLEAAEMEAIVYLGRIALDDYPIVSQGLAEILDPL